MVQRSFSAGIELRMAEDNGAVLFMSADDGSLPGANGKEEELMAFRHAYEMDQYYPVIEKYTFRTLFVPVSMDEARAWRNFNRGGAVLSFFLSGGSKDLSGTLFWMRFEILYLKLSFFVPDIAGSLTKKEEALMDAIRSGLQDKLDQLLLQLPGAPGLLGRRAFVRLSTRSPKDAVDKVPRLHAELVACIAKELREQAINTFFCYHVALPRTGSCLLYAICRRRNSSRHSVEHSLSCRPFRPRRKLSISSC